MTLKTPPAYGLRRRLVVLAGTLVGITVASGATTAFMAIQSREAIATSHKMDVAARRAAMLSVLVREQYIHEAHTIILRDHSHVAHHDAWVEKLSAELDDLEPSVEAESRSHIDAIRAASNDLHGIFAEKILPAIDAQDSAEVRRAHGLASDIVDRMTEHADHLAASFEARASASERGAERVVTAAVWGALVLAIAASVLALLAGRALWKAFAAPLTTLERVAEQVAAGDRQARVQPLAARELDVVASAFNRMLDALAAAEREVVASERLAAIGRVAAGVAHEINNPIAVIRGYVKLMRGEGQVPTPEELTIIDEEAAACQRIAEDLLVYAQAPASISRSNVDAEELLRGAASRSEAPISRREKLAPSMVLVEAEPAVIAVDALRIRQVIVNLVSNAREATEEGGSVLVRGTRQGRGYRIEVLDNGGGFSSDDAGRLFEPFFTTRQNGTGLGLAVCYGLVSAHLGTIHAEPRPEGGTRFVVDLPNVAVERAHPGAERS